MTWNPLRKPYVSSRPQPAQPCLTIAEDRELDLTVQRIMQMEGIIRKMTREMKEYLSAIKQLDLVDQRLTTNLSSCKLVHIHDDLRKIVENYLSVTTQVGKTVEQTVSLCEKTFIEPLKKLREEFILIRDALNKREELVNTWKISYTNLKKYQEKREKTANLIVKLEREKKTEELSRNELRVYHTNLLKELPAFFEKRLEYLKPSIHALIATQLNYYGIATEMFTKLMPVPNSIESPSSAMLPEEEYQQIINVQFNRLKKLAITKSD